MTVRWEELTGDAFPEAVERCGGVCLVALSVLERHGHHLPLGTDMYQGRAVLERAAEREPAILYPDYVYTQISEARHLPGTISLDGDVVLALLDNVCREIARNGLKKIVLVSAHGGNRFLIPVLPGPAAGAGRGTTRCTASRAIGGGQRPEVPWDRAVDGHAGPGETSMMLAIRPDLVHVDRVPAGDEWRAQGRLQALREAGAETGMSGTPTTPPTTPATRTRPPPRPASGCSTPAPPTSPAPCAPSRPTRRPRASRRRSTPAPNTLRPSQGATSIPVKARPPALSGPPGRSAARWSPRPGRPACAGRSTAGCSRRSSACARTGA